MEESFRERVDKTFRSLTPSLSAPLSALWCLTDDEIETNGRNRDEEVSEPRPGPFRSTSFLDSLTQEKKSKESHAQLEKDLNELDVDDGGEEDGQEEELKPDDYNEEEWEIKYSIGLDCTLDFEEEEDEYDKVAVGKGKRGDRLYMKDVNDYETEADEWDAFPISFKDLGRDPRANHIAAKQRLKEDVEAAKKMNSLHVSEACRENQFMFTSENRVAVEGSENKDEFLVSENTWSRSQYKTQLKVSESDNNNLLSLTGTRESLPAPVGILEHRGLKPILKRKDNQIDLKLQKRVRFSADYSRDEQGEEKSAMEAFSAGEDKVQAEYPCGIPDYMRNPSKYTRYTFDSGAMDEESNRKAYTDFLNMIKGREKSEEHTPREPPRSVTFVPKRKPLAETELGPCYKGKVTEGKRGVMAVDTEADYEVCPMEEDDPTETTVNVTMRRDTQRCSRQYRSRMEDEPDVR